MKNSLILLAFLLTANFITAQVTIYEDSTAPARTDCKEINIIITYNEGYENLQYVSHGTYNATYIKHSGEKVNFSYALPTGANTKQGVLMTQVMMHSKAPNVVRQHDIYKGETKVYINGKYEHNHGYGYSQEFKTFSTNIEKAKANAIAKAQAEAEAEAKAKALEQEIADAKAEAKAKVEAEAKAKAEAEAKAKADAEAKAYSRDSLYHYGLELPGNPEFSSLKETERLHALHKPLLEQRAKAKADAEAKAQAILDDIAKAEAEAEAKVIADAKADAEAKANAKVKAENREHPRFILSSGAGFLSGRYSADLFSGDIHAQASAQYTSVQSSTWGLSTTFGASLSGGEYGTRHIYLGVGRSFFENRITLQAGIDVKRSPRNAWRFNETSDWGLGVFNKVTTSMNLDSQRVWGAELLTFASLQDMEVNLKVYLQIFQSTRLYAGLSSGSVQVFNDLGQDLSPDFGLLTGGVNFTF